MTLPQRLLASKAIVLPLLLVSLWPATPVAAQDDGRLTLFSCGTDPVKDAGFLDLNGIPDNDNWVDLRFDRTADGSGHLTYSFPRSGEDYRTAFLFSHSNGPEGYLVSIRWKDEGLNYVYYSLDVPPDPGVEDDAGGGEAGLVISQHGKMLEFVQCIERPYMFISYMRSAMRCDTTNPYGPEACTEAGVERKVPLDVATIGVVAD